MFKFTKTKIPDVIVIEPQVFWDERGFFMETYSFTEFKQNWITVEFIQDNHSKSKKWVFRWFHFQTKNTQSKLVRVISWSVLDFAIDLRKDSTTYWKYIVEKLSEKNKKQLFIPQWFAHWFLTLENDTEFVYKCDNYYSPEHDGWIIYSDTDLNIDFWEIKNKYNIDELHFSDKDKTQPTINEFYSNNPF